MNLAELNKIDPRLTFNIERKGHDYCARAEVPFGDAGRLSIYTSEGYVVPPELGTRFDAGFVVGDVLSEIIWYKANELGALLDALKIEAPALTNGE